MIRDATGDSAGCTLRDLRVAGRDALVVYAEGVTDKHLVADHVVGPLQRLRVPRWASPDKVLKAMARRGIESSEAQETTSLEVTLSGVSRGDCAVFIDGAAMALVCDVRGGPKRNVQEPDNEPVLRGPRDGFAEDLSGNVALLRRRIRDPRLHFSRVQIGRLTQTAVLVAYMRHLAPPELVREVKTRLGRIHIDGVLESGYLEDFIEDQSFSIFPQVLRTERPDRVAADLLEGRVAILTDNTPFVITVPVNLLKLLTSPEDYYERFFIGTFLRVLRIAAFVVTLLLPALYVAALNYHQEMLPTPLILTVATQRQGVPAPTFIEALALQMTFEVLFEASQRLPRIIGPAISIIGVLIIGQASVEAGLVSPLVIIVVAFTGLVAFTLPVSSLTIAVRFGRLVFLVAAGVLGMFGLMAVLFLLLVHLAGLRSFGYPYLAPLTPLVRADLKDVVRVPWWAMRTRPRLTTADDLVRVKPGLRPRPSGRNDPGETDR